MYSDNIKFENPKVVNNQLITCGDGYLSMFKPDGDLIAFTKSDKGPKNSKQFNVSKQKSSVKLPS